MATPLEDGELLASVKAFRELSSIRAAADHLGVARSTLRRRLETANQRGLDGYIPEALPIGQTLKGVSTLYGPEGEKIAQWVKVQSSQTLTDAVEAITEAFEGWKGTAKLVKLPKGNDADLMTVYPIADHHLGLYSWGEETGADYDLAIGEKLLRDSMAELVSSAPAAETAIVLNLGDFFHSDNSENRTMRSDNALDVDSRYAKVLQAGVSLMMHCVGLALQKHKSVIVRNIPGNHDDHSALALTAALAAFYSREPRVTVDLSPSLHYFHRFGKTFIGATHGHTVKPGDMAGMMASTYPQDWGLSEHRYMLFGHIHHKTALEKHGVICESFQTLAAKDAWAAGKGFSSGRSMTAITYHRESGERFRHIVSV